MVRETRTRPEAERRSCRRKFRENEWLHPICVLCMCGMGTLSCVLVYYAVAAAGSEVSRLTVTPRLRLPHEYRDVPRSGSSTRNQRNRNQDRANRTQRIRSPVRERTQGTHTLTHARCSRRIHNPLHGCWRSRQKHPCSRLRMQKQRRLGGASRSAAPRVPSGGLASAAPEK